MTSFPDALSQLICEETPSIGADAGHAKQAIHALVSALALACAVSVRGDPERLAELMDVVSLRLIESSTRVAPVVQAVVRAAR